MPIYEYRCESCGHVFEKFVRRRNAEPEACPECEDADIERLISNTNFQLKGSGWYETDYARNDEGAGGEGGGADAGAPASGAEEDGGAEQADDGGGDGSSTADATASAAESEAV